MKSKSLRILILFLLFFSVILYACGTSAAGTPVSDPQIPRLTTDTGWWIDTTGKVRSDVMQALNDESTKAEKDGFQIGGVIWSNSVSDGMKLCTDFGNANGIGSKALDNGLAICIFLDKEGGDGNAPAISVAVGKGLEGSINDAKAGRFLDTYFVPARTAGEWEKGAIDLTSAFHRYLVDPKNDEFKDKPAEFPWGLLILVICLLFLILFLDGSFNNFALTSAFLDGTSSIGGGGSFGGGGASR